MEKSLGHRVCVTNSRRTGCANLFTKSLNITIASNGLTKSMCRRNKWVFKKVNYQTRGGTALASTEAENPRACLLKCVSLWHIQALDPRKS